MSIAILIRLWDSSSDNRKSKIENRKWAGIFAIVIAFAMCGAVAQAQQPQKVFSIADFRLGIRTCVNQY